MKQIRISATGRKIGAILAVSLCLSPLSGCSNKDTAPSGQPEQQETQNQESQGQELTGEQNAPDTYRPSDLTIQSQDSYDYPPFGLNFTLPQILREQMDNQQVAMVEEASAQNDGSIDYVIFSWNQMTKEQLEAEVANKGNGFYDWVNGLDRIGVLGVYHSSQLDNLDILTKCGKHKKLGDSPDGAYSYYLSTNPDADKALTKAILQINAKITEMKQIENGSNTQGGSLGEFSMQDIHGQDYTNDMFKDYQLTMVNVFTTWCSPCINEIPDLQKLYNEMEGQGVNVVGIVLDAIDESGNVNEEAVEKAKLLAERTKASYPFLIPDASYLNGRLQGIDAVPETFFVNKNGDITGQTYSGSHPLEDWKKIVETELGNLTGDGE